MPRPLSSLPKKVCHLPPRAPNDGRTVLSSSIHRITASSVASLMVMAAASLLPTSAAAQADMPGAGRTRHFEVAFMQMAIDHHYSALRITELAAGTDMQRTGELSPAEGTSPTPGFASTPAKATLDDLKSMSRRNNRMQREEIQHMKTMLKEWYGIEYQPRLSAEGRRMITVLERARPGAEFNRLFYEVFSRHHYQMLEPASACVTASDLHHEALRRECKSMWQGQTADIEMMREELKKHFGIVDYQPFQGHDPLHGDASGNHAQHTDGNHGR